LKRYLPYLLGTFLVQSCCAFHVVTVKNDSGGDRLVTLHGHRYYDYSAKDYFWLSDLSSKRHKSKTSQKLQSVTVDSAERNYSFILPKNTKLIIQHGMGFPDFDQQVIVDNCDTIRLRNDPRTKLKFRRIDYFITMTVDIHGYPSAVETAATGIRGVH
jgi:hypothetical protein